MTTDPRAPRARATRRIRTLLAGVLTAATALTGLALSTPQPAHAAPTAAPSWIGGKDLYATSALMSQQLPRSSTVYLTSGESGGDALAVPPAAVAAGAHVLMVRRDSVPASVEAQLRRLNPRYVNVVGARNVLSDALWRDVRSILPRASIYRVGLNAGDRVDSALALAGHIKRDNGRLDTVFVIGRNGYSDGLASGNVAARIGGAIIPAMGDATAWARKVAPLLNGTRHVVFVGAGSVLPQSYWNALDRILSLDVAMERLAGPDRYATNARVIEAFVGGISAPHVYLVAGNGHGDTVGASVLAARQDSIMMLSGRYCHDHEAIPSQVDWFDASRVIGIGTKFWITKDALQLRMCGGGYWEDWAFDYDAGAVLAQPMAPAASFSRPQLAAGRALGTFPGSQIRGTGPMLVGLPMGVANPYVTFEHDGAAASRVTALDENLAGGTFAIGSGSSGPFSGTALVRANHPIVYLRVEAPGPWELRVQDARHMPVIGSGSRLEGQGRMVALYEGPKTKISIDTGRGSAAMYSQWLWTTQPRTRSTLTTFDGEFWLQGGPQIVSIEHWDPRDPWTVRVR
ncbi:cell wall-binding repeat-containing protein [Agrococcus baldri]|uniref:Cell wall binding repeat 2 n=1 Tax=Agrococcus baldri TaxID=153730 RepID=A0AA87RGJ9_9MICO|nr:cell wall-binding repeat-containing protein [Agrococcus baldri]GEK79203.1 hypothetical protein ABA31_05540 [Agrococcus baldri]